MSSQRARLAALLHATSGDDCGLDLAGCPAGERILALPDALLARGVRVLDGPERFDRDERDAEAERRFLQPLNPDPLTALAPEMTGPARQGLD